MQDGEFYWRYFRIDNAEFNTKMQDIQARILEVSKQLSAFAHSMGAESLKTWAFSGEFAGFIFQDPPDEKAYMKTGGLYVPRRSTAEGKAVWDLVKQLPKGVNTNSVLGDYGLTWGKPIDDDGAHPAYAVVTGFYEPGIWFVKVPSRHFEEASLEAIKQVLADTGSHVQGIYTNALWEVPEGWKQVKQWEFLREWEELQEQYS